MRAAFVGNTDERWFEFLRSRARNGRLDEVNFWKPSGVTFNLPRGAAFFLRLKKPHFSIAGFGFFADYQRMRMPDAWRFFGEKNGAASFEDFVAAVNSYRGRQAAEMDPRWSVIGCIALREVQFLDERVYWRENVQWADHNPPGRHYDMDVEPGSALLDVLALRPQASAPELTAFSPFVPLLGDDRSWWTTQLAVREGQGAFRMRVLKAYEERCAVTGERTKPVLEAAHIQRYLGPLSNHVQNGLALRADLHALYDEGLITVTPELRVRVSGEIDKRFHNGKVYYALSGQPLQVIPRRLEDRPSESALEWHESTLFTP